LITEWSFRDSVDKILPPLVYDHDKTQETVVNEALEALDEHGIIFIHGGVGTGKSVIALHLIAYYGKGIIAVPTKVLEEQYVEDHCGEDKPYIEVQGKPLRVNKMRGRTNFPCLKQPKNRLDPVNCGHPRLPCTRTLRIGETRLSVAINCPYWSPIYSSDTDVKILEETHDPYPYMSISGKKIYYEAEKPCPYYKQFRHYIPPGAIIMNSAKWEAETWLQRKPMVTVEVIDEADSFLDGLSYKTQVTHRLLENLKNKELLTEEEHNTLDLELAKYIHRYRKQEEFELSHDIQLVAFLKYLQNIFEETEDTYLKGAGYKLDVLLEHRQYAWAVVTVTEKSRGFTFYIPRLDITLDLLRKRSGKLVLMSATRHSDKVLKDIFRIQPHHVVAQEENPGTLYLMNPVHGALLNVTYTNWKKEKIRQRYWRILDEQLQVAPRPCYVLVHAYKYLPPKYQPTKKEAKEPHWQHPQQPHVHFSTKMDRGIDLPDEKCRSIILLKYPWPSINDPVLKTMKKQYGTGAYWNYLRDHADRNMLQQCGRAIRNKEDWCQVYSPDKNVPNNLVKVWKGRLVETTYPGGVP
jgi:Rad3-related DNA helicase